MTFFPEIKSGGPRAQTYQVKHVSQHYQKNTVSTEHNHIKSDISYGIFKKHSRPSARKHQVRNFLEHFSSAQENVRKEQKRAEAGGTQRTENEEHRQQTQNGADPD